VGNYAHVPITVVPHPKKDSTHFHLIYATRSIKGLEVFKSAERAASEVAGEVRADAKRRKRELNTRQPEMLPGDMLPDTNYSDKLRQHYQSLAREVIVNLLDGGDRVLYDNLYSAALRFPLVTERDLRGWISEIADVQGLAPREKVPKICYNHFVQQKSKPQLLL
jgi:hypothetical protein